MNTKEVMQKVVHTMSDAKGYAYTVRYLESMLVTIIDKYVKHETELRMLHINLLGEAIDLKIEKKGS